MEMEASNQNTKRRLKQVETAKLAFRKTRSNATLYYKACTKHFPVLLCTTKFAQTTSQYYFDAAAARSNLDAATTMRSTPTASEIAAPTTRN